MSCAPGREGAQPLVSVIVPCYNYGHFVGQTLSCIQRQSERSWEAIVVDDGSTDGTAEVVAGFSAADPRIRCIRQAQTGASAARNRGLRLARGQYVQFLDADDLIEEQKLARQIALLQRHSDAGIVYGDVRYFDSEQPPALRRGMHGDEPWMPCVSGVREALVTLLQGNIMAVQAALARREVIAAVGGFDEALRAMEDWDLWLRCAIAGARFLYADERGTRSLARVHPPSLSRNSGSMELGAAKVREKLLAMLPHSPLLRQAWDEAGAAWQGRLEQAAGEVEALLPRRGRLILIDEDQVRGRRERLAPTLPMVEREGRYWGRPADDAEALRELVRLRALGAGHIAFSFNAFWWLDHYAGLRHHLSSHARLIHRSQTLRVYEFAD
jgi:glycosyl transferase family 2